eukprot:512582-Pyramimonas_sp.AAC.1
MKGDAFFLVQFVFAAPETPPLSKLGKGIVWDDPHAEEFVATLRIIVSQAVREGSKLEAFMIEAVPRLADIPRKCSSSPLEDVELFLSESLGESWKVFTWTVSSYDMGVPQARTRLYVCGRLATLFRAPVPETTPETFSLELLTLWQLLDETARP